MENEHKRLSRQMGRVSHCTPRIFTINCKKKVRHVRKQQLQKRNSKYQAIYSRGLYLEA
jgi:hypothetical protein